MEYSIREVSKLAGVSGRTLRYYDQIGLLKPLYVNQAGYRFYGAQELDLLQQILFYRERGFALQEIADILYSRDFDVMSALQEHLSELECQRDNVERLIMTVKHTIASMKGEYQMSDKEKFAAFKKQLVEENEQKYGAEIRKKYGEEEVEASNRRMLNMNEEEYNRLQSLAEEINQKLEAAVTSGVQPDSETGKRIVERHRQWLCMTWKEYSAEAHIGLAQMYVADQRFTKYYDSKVSGCAQFLEKAVQIWAKEIACQ